MGRDLVEVDPPDSEDGVVAAVEEAGKGEYDLILVSLHTLNSSFAPILGPFA